MENKKVVFGIFTKEGRLYDIVDHEVVALYFLEKFGFDYQWYYEEDVMKAERGAE
jgi:predicted deacetylase